MKDFHIPYDSFWIYNVLFKIPGVPVKNERKRVFYSPKHWVFFLFKLEQPLINIE